MEGVLLLLLSFMLLYMHAACMCKQAALPVAPQKFRTVCCSAVHDE
jgi:hypothetical protein